MRAVLHPHQCSKNNSKIIVVYLKKLWHNAKITLIPAFLVKKKKGFVWKSDVISLQEKTVYFGKQLSNGMIILTKLEPPKTHYSGYVESNPTFLSLKLGMI